MSLKWSAERFDDSKYRFSSNIFVKKCCLLTSKQIPEKKNKGEISISNKQLV